MSTTSGEEAQANALRLIVGLGNPGTQYEWTPHNIGFHVVDAFAEKVDVTFRYRRKALYAHCILRWRDQVRTVWLIKPQTYMNLSGEAVLAWVQYLKVDVSPERVLVVVDDLDLPWGKLKFTAEGKPGTHRGLQDIARKLGTFSLCRLRIGVGPRPPDLSPAEYVLRPVGEDRMGQVRSVIMCAVRLLCLWVFAGWMRAQNLVATCVKDQPPRKWAHLPCW